MQDVVHKTKSIFVGENEKGNQKNNKNELNEEEEIQNYNRDDKNVNLDYNKMNNQKGSQELTSFFKEENQSSKNKNEDIDDLFNNVNNCKNISNFVEKSESSHFDFVEEKPLRQMMESENIFTPSRNTTGNGNLITFNNEEDNNNKNSVYPDFDDFDTNKLNTNVQKTHTEYPSLDNFNFNINYYNK